jgi:hypothetical protein
MSSAGHGRPSAEVGAGQVLSSPVPTAPVEVLLLYGPGGADVLDATGLSVPGLARQVIERAGWAGPAARAQDGPAATETS